MNLGQALQRGLETLTAGKIETAQIDSEVLLRHCVNISAASLLAFPERLVSEAQWQSFKALIERRSKGLPVAYLTGEQEFWSLPLLVSEDVLIPRPDTEQLVERALARVNTQKCRIADLGTGSGAIALALASELPAAELVATDSSTAALEIARANVIKLALGNVQVMQSNWFDGLADSKFDLVVSNPPYIDPLDPHLAGEIRFEPSGALVANQNGLADLFAIIEAAPDYIVSGGWLLLEHGFDQANAVAEEMRRHGFLDVTGYRDYGGNPRVTEGRVI